MKPHVVVTTIHAPSDSVRAFARRGDCEVIAVADRKTPPDWTSPPATFLSLAKQRDMAERYPLVGAIPFDHYARKLIGYLYAIECGADVIVDADDDTAPHPDWSIPPFASRFAVTPHNLGMVNVYASFTRQFIWPRGFPLTRIRADESRVRDDALTEQDSRVGIWQSLIDGDSDVDAVYRLVCNTPCMFDDRPPIVLAPGTTSCFNSQNTMFHQAAFPLLYLPCSVTFRFTDILRGWVAQPILWCHGYRLGFTGASATQCRNPHDLLRDFESEIPMYLHAEQVIDIVQGSVSAEQTIGANLASAYDALAMKGIVDAAEPGRLELWLEALGQRPQVSAGERQPHE